MYGQHGQDRRGHHGWQAQQNWQPAHAAGVKSETFDDNSDYVWVEENDEIPHVDDLEVAAAAAEADMEAAAQYAHLAQSNGAFESSDVTSSEDDSDDDSEEDMDDGIGRPQPFAIDDLIPRLPGPASEMHVRVSFSITEAGEVSVALKPQQEESDVSDWENDSEPGGDLRTELEQMEVDGEDARMAFREAEEMEAAEPPVEILDVEINEQDALHPLGTITAVLGSRMIIQAPMGARAVEEGSVVCLSDRTPLGRVEELFGPVDAPLYSLRYAGGGDMPASVEAGTAACCPESLSKFILPEDVKASSSLPLDEEEVEEDGDHLAASDDDAETAVRKAAMASQFAGARAGPNRGRGRGGGGPSGRRPRDRQGGRRGERRGRGAPGSYGFPPAGQPAAPPGGQWVYIPAGQMPQHTYAQPPPGHQFWGQPIAPQGAWGQPPPPANHPSFYPQGPP